MSNKKNTKTKPKETKKPQTDYSYNTILNTQQQTDVTIPPEVQEKIKQISSMFPDLPEDIIYSALQEYNFDVEEVIQKQLDGQLQWTQVKKPKSKNEYKELVKQKTRAARGRKNRANNQRISKQGKEQKQQPRKKPEQSAKAPGMGEVRQYQQVNENVQSDHVLSYSEVAAQQPVTQPVQDEETQQKKLTKKEKKKQRKKRKNQQEQQKTTKQETQQYEQQIEKQQQIVSQKPVTQQTKYTPPVVSQPKLEKVILPSVETDVPQLQFGTLGIEQQTKPTTQFGSSILRTQSQQSTKQEISENLTKQTQNVQTETENTGTSWENQFHPPFYNYPQPINDNRTTKKESSTDDKTQQPYAQKQFVPSHQFIPGQYSQYYGYPPYMIPPNQFQYQGYPHPNSKFPQAPFYNKGVYGYGTNYPVNNTGIPYEEMDYTKMGQQMYFVPPQHKPQSQDNSSKTKPQSPNVYMQDETFEQQQHAPYFGELYHPPYNIPYMYQPNPYQNPTLSQQKMYNSRQPEPKQQTTQTSQQQKQGPGNWDSQVYGH